LNDEDKFRLVLLAAVLGWILVLAMILGPHYL